MKVTVLVGGVGGARFLLGVKAALGLPAVGRPAEQVAHEITAVVNVGDDIWLHGLRICPDLDTCMYTLGGGIDPERGWGRAEETWTVRDELAAYGADPSLVRPRRPRHRHPPGAHPDAARRLPALRRHRRAVPPLAARASRCCR